MKKLHHCHHMFTVLTTMNVFRWAITFDNQKVAVWAVFTVFQML